MSIYKDFDIFSRALIASKDVDPTYPVINRIVELHPKFEPEWFSFLYLAFYNLESGIKVCREMPNKESWDEDKFRFLKQNEVLRFGHERRGTARNTEVQIKHLTEVKKWLESKNHKKAKSQEDFRKSVESLPNMGNWASFKIAEIFEKAFKYENLQINDLGLEGRDLNSNDGPVGGLRHLFDSRDIKLSIKELWYRIWNEFGYKLAETWNVDIGEVETCLCKWWKFVSGKYYIGHDIHEFLELEHIMGRKYPDLVELFDESLFEIGGKKVSGVSKQHKSIYNKEGVIINKQYSKELPKADVEGIIFEVLF